jgi:hypothetical protein
MLEWKYAMVEKTEWTIRAIITLTWKVKCLKSLIICFLFSVFCFLFSVFCFLFSVFCFLFSVFCFLFSSSRNGVCVSASQAQFPMFQSFQFTIQISFQNGGHSMGDYFSLKQFLHLSTDFTAFFCGFWIYPTLYFLRSRLGVFSRATSLEMRYLDRWVFRILYVVS